MSPHFLRELPRRLCIAAPGFGLERVGGCGFHDRRVDAPPSAFRKITPQNRPASPILPDAKNPVKTQLGRITLFGKESMRSIIQIEEWPVAGVGTLIDESEAEGFRFLQRLRTEWLSGTNRFSNTGEALFGLIEEKRLVAIGGINRESKDCGRLRRFFVRKDARRRGIGRALVEHLLGFASKHYSRVVLRTDTETADRFYLSLGFDRLSERGDATHLLELKKRIVSGLKCDRSEAVAAFEVVASA